MGRGLIHVYTGDGKGKTTSSIGLAIRASGAGNKVYFIQFLKGNPTAELKTLERLKPDIEVFRFEKPRDFVWNLSIEEREELEKEIHEAFKFVREVLEKGSCDLLIMDEITGVLTNGFIPLEEFLNVLENKADKVEVVMTGRNCPQEIIDFADYCTNMQAVKHPYKRGIYARKGIEY